jgi:hypothetical protein
VPPRLAWKACLPIPDGMTRVAECPAIDQTVHCSVRAAPFLPVHRTTSESELARPPLVGPRITIAASSPGIPSTCLFE